MTKMNTTTLTEREYLRFDNTTFRLKGVVEKGGYTDDKNRPYWVNRRLLENDEIGWGYCDNDGIVWEVKWI